MRCWVQNKNWKLYVFPSYYLCWWSEATVKHLTWYFIAYTHEQNILSCESGKKLWRAFHLMKISAGNVDLKDGVIKKLIFAAMKLHFWCRQENANENLSFLIADFISSFAQFCNYFNTQRFLLMSNLVLAGQSPWTALWTPQTPSTFLKSVGHSTAKAEQMKAKIATKIMKNFI